MHLAFLPYEATEDRGWKDTPQRQKEYAVCFNRVDIAIEQRFDFAAA
jgi:hypothetical protein